MGSFLLAVFLELRTASRQTYAAPSELDGSRHATQGMRSTSDRVPTGRGLACPLGGIKHVFESYHARVHGREPRAEHVHSQLAADPLGNVRSHLL